MGCHRRFRFVLAALLASAGLASAGGGPQEVLVVVNDTSPLSQEVGLTYARLRGMHERQILHLTNVVTENMQIVSFSNDVRHVVLDYLAASGLSNQVQYVVFAPEFPYRVHDLPYTNYHWSSLSSCMYYDYRFSANAITAGCLLSAEASNVYFGTERAFERAATPEGRYLLSGQLYAWNGDEARRLVRRAQGADGGAATGTAYLLHTTDSARNVRWRDFEEARYRSLLQAGSNGWAIQDADAVTGAVDVLGYLTGLGRVTGVHANTYHPGAYADNLTSYGGYLIDAPSDQMSMLEWIRAGAAGTYGTIVEPCNYTEKYADPMLLARYERGFTLGEALYLSVQNPYQGLLVGDPLCAPFAHASAVQVAWAVTGGVASGVATVQVSAAAADGTRPIHRLDVFMDDLWCATLTNQGPRAGNVLEIAVNGSTAGYTVVEGQSLCDAATGLAAAVNAALPFVRATPVGDAVQLVHTNYGVSGLTNQVSAQALAGTADVVQVQARAVAFADSVFPAREFLALGGSGDAGDVVRCVITLTNGVVVTNQVTASMGQGAASVMAQLRDAINAHADLTNADGVVAKYLFTASSTELALEARTAGPMGYQLFVVFQVIPNPPPPAGFSTSWNFSDRFNDNGDVLRPRAMVYLAEGATSLVSAFAVATTNLADGPHRVRAVAYEGTAVRVQGSGTADVTVDNHGLVCELLSPAPGRYFLRGAAVTAEVNAAGAGTVTQVTVFVEGKVAGVDTSSPFAVSWATAKFGVGPVGVQARADNADGQQVLSTRREIVVYTDGDGDGLSDQWEYERLGSATNYNGAQDPDGDGAANVAEFLADTDPSNALSRFEITALPTPPDAASPSFSFVSRTTRVYQVGLQDTSLVSSAWGAATGAIAAAQGSTTWTDALTNAPAGSNAFRFYRVHAGLP